MLITTDHYTLTIRPKKDKTEIVMKLTNQDLYSTANLPNTVSILDNLLPSVLQTRCFNDQQLSFTEEVRKTELGHLFEHVLIDIMCMEKAKLTTGAVVYSGETSWNWRKFDRGSFYITISATKQEKELLQKCLEPTVSIINKVLES